MSMPEKMRPSYGGVRKSAEAEIQARRRDVETGDAPPPPAPKPQLMETRLKAIEAKLDLIIEVLQGGPSSADPSRKPSSRSKR